MEFEGKIEVVEIDNHIYFDVVDKDTGESLNKYLKSIKDFNPNAIAFVEVVTDTFIAIVTSSTILLKNHRRRLQ